MWFKYLIRSLVLFILVFGTSVFAKKNVEQNEIPLIAEDHILVKIETTMGSVYVDLDPKADPMTVFHFLKYVDNGFYKNLIFHRIIDGFIIQTGKYDPQFKIKNIKKIILNNQSKKTKLKNLYGTLAMARLESNPHSATTEFFINLLDNAGLNDGGQEYGYAVFGKVVKGMDVIKKISGIKTWEKNDLLYAPFYPNEALIKEITRVSNNTGN